MNHDLYLDTCDYLRNHLVGLHNQLLSCPLTSSSHELWLIGQRIDVQLDTAIDYAVTYLPDVLS